MYSLSEIDKKILYDIDVYGWHVIKVQEDELGPSFGYSVGLYHTFNHPEIIIIGLDITVIHNIINHLGHQIKEGLVLKHGQFYSNIIEHGDCFITQVNPLHYDEYLSYNNWFYKSDNFPCLQCVYPLLSGTFPWQENVSEKIKKQQPVLGKHPI